jgi:ribonuclease HI
MEFFHKCFKECQNHSSQFGRRSGLGWWGLVWSITAKNIYQALLMSFDYQVDSSWFKQLWKWPIQLKLKLFVWLAAKDKVLTWESLQRKGWHGPGVCKLCNCSSETINHLLIHCSFTKSVWHYLSVLYKVKFQWIGNSVFECFKDWMKDKSAPASLAATTCWHIWIERNKVLFEERSPSHRSVVHRISGTFTWQPTIPKFFQNRVCEFNLADGYTLACFDGAALANGECCGAGGIFKTHASRTTKWFLNCGAGTNTKAELLGLWATLLLATLWSIDKIKILGDSKVIIDWIKQQGQLNSVNIECWKLKTLDLASKFKDISFQHIYREHNKEADLLSKRALKETKGRLSVFHWENGEESSHSFLNIFED